MTTTEFAAPGHGQWNLDRSHFPGGTTPIVQWLMEESMHAGMRRVFVEIGTPVESVQARFVHGFMYTRLRPLLQPDRPPSKRLPPAPVLKLVAHVHPAFRARAKSAARALDEGPWNAVVKQWDVELRPTLLRQNRQFQSTDLAALDDAALDAHIGALLDHCRTNAELHFWLHGFDLGPLARYLSECIAWGIDPDEAFSALAGASPSTSAPARRLARIRSLLDAIGCSPNTLDDVRAAGPEAAALLDQHLDELGYRLVTGYDLDNLTLIEMPDAILAGIRGASEPTALDHRAIAARLREMVPEADRSTFDAVLADARGVMDLRDDQGPFTIEWPTGLLRHAMLEAGRRLTARNELASPAHVFELTPDEARTAMRGPRPSTDTLATRAQHRSTVRTLSPPITLGPIEPSPSPDVLPVPLPKMVRMVQTAMKYMGMDASVRTDPMSGAGIGTHTYVGRVRKAATAEEAIMSMEAGDVLVVRATSPAFNAVLSIAGAVVTADGGVMSHAAVLARELGIPAVVGASGALDLPDGATVEVDPVAGRVRLVG